MDLSQCVNMLLALACARQRADTNLCEKGGEKVLNKNLVQIYSNTKAIILIMPMLIILLFIYYLLLLHAVNKVIFQKEDEIAFQTGCPKAHHTSKMALDSF